MKTLVLLLLLFVGLGANSQSIQEVNTNQISVKTGYSFETGRIAFATADKDTLYVIRDMYHMILIMWEYPPSEDKPIFIKVDSLEPFLTSAGTKED